MGTVIASLVLAGLLALAVRSIFRDMKAGGGCGCGCSGCSGCGGGCSCQTQLQMQNPQG